MFSRLVCGDLGEAWIVILLASTEEWPTTLGLEILRRREKINIRELGK